MQFTIYEAYKMGVWTEYELDMDGFLITAAHDINQPLAFISVMESYPEGDFKEAFQRQYNSRLRKAKLIAREPRYIEGGWNVHDYRTPKGIDPAEWFLAPVGGGVAAAQLRCNPSASISVIRPPETPDWVAQFEAGLNMLCDSLDAVPMHDRRDASTPNESFAAVDHLHNWRRHILRRLRRRESSRLRRVYHLERHRTEQAT